MTLGDNIILKDNALEIVGAISEADWVKLGEHLLFLDRGHQWWIGDWANYGEREYGDLKRIAEERGLNYGTMRKYAYVSNRFELFRRRNNLSFTHHAEVAGLDDEAASRLLDDAQRNDLSVADLRALVYREQNTVGQTPGTDTCSVEDLAALAGREKFGTVYADPPWLYGNQGTRAATGRHYGGMSVADIAALPVAQLVADNAHLHLWTTNAFLFDAPKIIEAWGFEYKSCFIWVKPQMGIGNYWRVSHEFLLFAVRGSAAFANHGARSWLEARRGKHSAKPEVVRGLIESASPGPYLEMFGRRNATGWTVWGNEIQRTMLDFDVEEVVL